jgi:hypothetical protein
MHPRHNASWSGVRPMWFYSWGPPPTAMSTETREGSRSQTACDLQHLLEWAHPRVVLQWGPPPRGGKRRDEGGQPEPDYEVERSVPAEDVRAVERRGDR